MREAAETPTTPTDAVRVATASRMKDTPMMRMARQLAATEQASLQADAAWIAAKEHSAEKRRFCSNADRLQRREQAERDLLSTMVPDTLADVAVALSCAAHEIEGLDVNEHNEAEVGEKARALTRMIWTCVPIVAEAVGLNTTAMGWKQRIQLHALPSETSAAEPFIVPRAGADAEILRLTAKLAENYAAQMAWNEGRTNPTEAEQDALLGTFWAIADEIEPLRATTQGGISAKAKVLRMVYHSLAGREEDRISQTVAALIRDVLGEA